ncbi:MAG: ornithine cyclodeaminase family protein [Pseudomonadota bacterium]|nr:ornithine cyclodeaminase family protein [Pseudomonadota bacterium]MEC8153981.1 ornithine cyclodeaminase family protein [Pseudomonadota bacterium]MEC8710367.1 ornithine cyclodeaminase family protein [Pseudomonadota bacterium]
MRFITAPEIEIALDQKSLIEALRRAFRMGASARPYQAPLRNRFYIENVHADPTILLNMPSWQVDGDLGIKMVTVNTGNPAKGLPMVQGAYLFLDAGTGKVRGILEAEMITVKRTAAASALASSYLSRSDASRLLIVGAGALARHFIDAHRAVRPISDVLVWNRTPKRAEELVANYRLQEDASALNSIGVTDDLEAAVSGADIVTCITASSEPVIFGDWVREGTHVDLVGAFSPDSRESDDALVQKARIFVDTRTGALAEAGDLIIPMNKGLITEDDVAADLFDLTQGERDGRRFYEQITLFKNCGSAIEDLVAARLAYQRT